MPPITSSFQVPFCNRAIEVRNCTLFLDDVMEEHPQTLFLCVVRTGRSGKKGVTGKGADEGVGDGIFEAVKCVIISPASVFLIIHPAGF